MQWAALLLALFVLVQPVPVHRRMEDTRRGVWTLWLGVPHTTKGSQPTPNYIYHSRPPCMQGMPEAAYNYEEEKKERKHESLLDVVNVIRSSNGCVSEVSWSVCGFEGHIPCQLSVGLCFVLLHWDSVAPGGGGGGVIHCLRISQI